MKIVKSFKLSEWGVNCHIIKIEDEILLIDAPLDIQVVIDYLKENNLKLDKILLTHFHLDHMLGLDLLFENFSDVKLYCDKLEAKNLFNPEYTLASNYGIDYHKPHKINYLEDLNLKGLSLCFISGHSQKSTVYMFLEDKVVFCGDTVFKETIGRTDIMFGDAQSLIKGIKENLLVLDDDVICYPGHGDSTTIGYEKINNMHLK